MREALEIWEFCLPCNSGPYRFQLGVWFSETQFCDSRILRVLSELLSKLSSLLYERYAGPLKPISSFPSLPHPSFSEQLKETNQHKILLIFTKMFNAARTFGHSEPFLLYALDYRCLQILKWSEVKWNEVAQSCPTLCNPMDCSLPGFSFHGIFSRQEYWSGLPFPSPRELPDPEIEPGPLCSTKFSQYLA